MIDKITPDDLAKHLAWLRGENNGVQLSIPCGADLRNTNLREANLRKAVMCRVYLSAADMSGARLGSADLHGADLRGADLRGAELRNADLHGAELRNADLHGAKMYDVDLRGADLHGADLHCADLHGADLRGAKMYGALNIPDYVSAVTKIVPEGDIVVYKKLRARKIAKLRIPAEAKRSNATGRKCRAEYAEVLSIESIDGEENFEEGFSYREENPLCYKIGEIVRPDSFDEDRWNECSHGIHFFLTRYEAEVY